MIKGTIFDIKRFALHDGPGIRSTLFLKGCPLRCSWCHNPEGIDFTPRLWWFESRCIGCSSCIHSCPENALSAPADDPLNFSVTVDSDKCVACGVCVDECPSAALEFDGREIGAEEAAKRLLNDREFYLESRGGVTLSGGDPMAQPEFSAAVLGLCHAEGIHTAIETALLCTKESIQRLLPLTDLFIVDMKIHDAHLHRLHTGSSNSRIRRNIQFLLSTGKEVLFRLPLIPGISTSDENIRGIGRFLQNQSGLHKRTLRIELLNFNPLAGGKYERMKIPDYSLGNAVPLSPAELSRCADMLSDCGIEVLQPEVSEVGSE